MKVLFVNCVGYLEATIPEGVALLSAVLKESGHEAEVFDTSFLKPKGYSAKAASCGKETGGIKFHMSTAHTLSDMVADDPEVDVVEELKKKVREFGPDVVAVSAMTTNYDSSLELVKKAGLSCKVIFGGVHATLMPEDVINEKEADFVCVGEGEKALLELCEAMEKGSGTSEIKNIYAKKKNGEKVFIAKNELGPFIGLDELPVPDIGCFDERHFFRPFMGKIYRGVFLSTSRGCPRGCSYCVNFKLRRLYSTCGANYVRFQSPEAVARNVRALKEEYGITWFKFSDDTFLMRGQDDLEKLRDLVGPLGIMFGCSVDPATVTPEKVTLAKDMGCVAMSLGVETGNEKLRNTVLARRISNKQMERAFAILREHDIKISTFNIIGLPGETVSDIFETIKFNRKLGVPDANVYVLYPFPGTRIYEDYDVELRKNGRIPAMEEAHLFNLSRVPAEELLYYQKAFNLFLVLPEELWPEIKKARHDAPAYAELSRIAQNTVDRKTS